MKKTQLTQATQRLLCAIAALDKNGGAYSWNVGPYAGYQSTVGIYRPLKLLEALKLIERRKMRITLTATGRELARLICALTTSLEPPPPAHAHQTTHDESAIKPKPRLTPAAIRLLTTAAHIAPLPGDPVTPSEIAATLNLSRQAITEPLARLRAHQLIIHEPRRRTFTLTQSGHELAQKIKRKP